MNKAESFESAQTARKGWVGYVFGPENVWLITGIYLFVLFIHLGFITLWVCHAYVLQDWRALVYGHLEMTPEQINMWDYFHIFYEYGPLVLAIYGLAELVPLTRFYLKRHEYGDANISVDAFAFGKIWKLELVGLIVLMVLWVAALSNFGPPQNVHIILQVAIVLVWAKYVMAISRFVNMRR
jgi:hypothetical protein